MSDLMDAIIAAKLVNGNGSGGSGLSDELIAALTSAYEQGGFGFIEENLTLHSIDGLFLPGLPPIHTCNVRIDLDAAYDVSNYSSDTIWNDFFTEQGEIQNTNENDLCHVIVNCADGGTLYGSCWIYEQVPTNSDPVCAIGVCDLPESGIGPFKLVWLESGFTAEKMGS